MDLHVKGGYVNDLFYSNHKQPTGHQTSAMQGSSYYMNISEIFLIDKIDILLGVVSLLNIELRGRTTTNYNATLTTSVYETTMSIAEVYSESIFHNLL